MHYSRNGFRRSFAVLFGLSIAVAGCQTKTTNVIDDPITVTSHDQVGSVHVSIISSTPWDSVFKDLQPTFELKPADALAAALPVTQASLDRTVQALTLGLGIGLGQRGTNTSETTSTKSSSENKSVVNLSDLTTAKGTEEPSVSHNASTNITSTGTVEKSNSSESNKFRKASDGKDATFGALKKIDEISAEKSTEKPESLGINPSLQYKLAAALYQDVAVLNQHVKNIAWRHGYEPHLVVAQISLMPRSTRLPYDAYIDLNFFSTCLTADEKAIGSQGCGIRPDSSSATWMWPTTHAPKVIPLLSSDNLESAVASRSAQDMRQVALGLSGVLSGIGLNTQIGSVNDAFGSILGRQLNSIMTGGRVVDNTLRIRLGAVAQGPLGDRMVARTHNVSLVVLVPKNTHRVNVAAKTQFIDPNTLEVVPARSSTPREQDEAGHIAEKYPEFQLGKAASLSDNFKVLNQLAFAGNQRAFWEKVNQLFDQDDRAKSNSWPEPGDPIARRENRLRKASYLWADMVSLIPGSRFNHTSFDLEPKEPKRVAMNACPAPQTLVLVDDGGVMKGILNRGKELDADQIEAQLSWPECAGDTTFAPSLMTVAADGRSMALAFPSPAGLSMGGICRGRQAKIVLSGCKPADSLPTATFAVRYLPPPSAGFSGNPRTSTLSLSAIAVAAGQNGEQSVDIQFGRGTESKVYLRVLGADLVDPESSGLLNRTVNGLELKGSGKMIAGMRNLIADTQVVFWLENDAGHQIAGSRRQLPVRGSNAGASKPGAAASK